MRIAIQKTIPFFLIWTFIILSCTGQPQDPIEADTVFTHINVITMQSEDVLENQNVFVKNGKIISIGPADRYRTTANSTKIDGQSRYLMPGLAEMHAHIPVPGQGNATEETVKETLFLYLSNGITTIRGMLGAPYHLELKEKVVAGEILGPRIYTSGPSLNGRSVPDVATARRMVLEQKEAGYDFLKLHPGLTLEVFNALAKTADEADIRFAGHVSTDVGVRRAIEAKYATIDHLDGYLEALVPDEEKTGPGGFFGFNYTHLADINRLADLVAATKAADIWVVPTQSLMERISSPSDPEEMAREPEMQYVAPAALNFWIERKKRMLAEENYSEETAKNYISLRQKILKSLYDGGVGVLLGSDAPQVFNVPGFSIHHELKAYVEAGLTPYQALTTGTVNPAIFFGVEGGYGTITPGASADLILLEGNPLEKIENLQKQTGVMVRGKWLPERQIQAGLRAIAEKYASSN